MDDVLLDSTVVIDLLRRRTGAIDRLSTLRASGGRPFVGAITVEEISVGVRPRERDAASALLEALFPIPLGTAEGRLAGWWRRGFRQRGRTLSQADCLIAAAAVAIGGRLAMGNPKGFPMREFTVEHWPAGA